MSKKIARFFRVKRTQRTTSDENARETYRSTRRFDVSLLYDLSALSEIPVKATIVSLQDVNGYTLLHHAADLGCSDALKLLLIKKGT